MDPVADRKRRRTILGYSEIPCPHCGAGPLVFTSSSTKRRVRDLLNPRFDKKTVYRETCQACRVRFSVHPEARQTVARTAVPAGTAPAPAAPLFGAADPAEDEPVRPVTDLKSKKPTQAAFFTDDDELDED